MIKCCDTCKNEWYTNHALTCVCCPAYENWEQKEINQELLTALKNIRRVSSNSSESTLIGYINELIAKAEGRYCRGEIIAEG
jgi:hypothetical protein